MFLRDRYWKCLIVLPILTLSLAGTFTLAPAHAIAPPHTPVRLVTEVIHGAEVTDPYRWLEDRDDPETQRWIDEQVAYTKAVLNSLPGRDRIRKRLERLMRIDVARIPRARGGKYFYMRRRASQELYCILMRKTLKGRDITLIDPHSLSRDRTLSVTLLDVSNSGELLAYGVRKGGEDEITVKFFKVSQGKDIDDTLPKGRYFDVCIAPDDKTVYYSQHTKDGTRIYKHRIGSDSNDQLIFGEGYGPEKIISIELSDDGRYLLLTVYHGSAGTKTELYVKNLEENTPVTTIVNDIDASFEGHIGGDTLFVLTDWKAPKRRIIGVPLANPVRASWREIIPETRHPIREFSLAGGRIFVNYLENVIPTVRIFKPDGSFVGKLNVPSTGSISRVTGTWQGDEAFFSFTSFHIPRTIYRYNIKKGLRQIWFSTNVPMSYQKYEVKQVRFTSKDGTTIPMFVVQPIGLEYDGNNPTLLTGYGGFNASLTPYYSARCALWLSLGGVYAVANLRGGGEFGEEWHEAGMLENKQNTFDDFIAAAEWLISNGYTSPAKLGIAGTSNGGLLVGAALTQRPYLFGAVLCRYPLLDMLRYHKFLVGSFWISEYGSADNPDQFKYIYAYSPYHNVIDGTPYPAVLLVTGDADTRVDPLHARKMTARLQAASSSGKPVLLLYDTTSGHSGGKPLKKQVDDLTDEMLFLLWQLDVKY